MGKLKCICGHIIVDQTDNLSYKGYIIPHSQVESLSTSLTDNIDSLIDSIKSNNRLGWIEKTFGTPPYPTDLKDSDMIHDLLIGKLIDIIQDIFECESCGRIAIQVKQTNQFKFFTPDTDDTKGILNCKE